MKKAALRVLRRRHANLLKPHEERFARTYRGVMRDLKAGVNFPSRPAALVRREWKGRAVEALRPVYRAAILAGGQSYLNSLTIRQKAASFYATKAARRTASVVVLSLEEQFEARLEETIDTTFDSLEEILDEAAADGLDAGEIDDLVNEEFDDILGDRTDSIATTETNGAINSVQDYLALQLAELQAWVTAEDDRVRPTHVIYGDAGAKPVGFDWAQLVPDAGYTLRYPCDPACHEPAEIVNCRCFTVPAGEVELSPSEMKDYLSDFEMDPEDILLSEDQEPVYVVNQYTGKTVKGDYANHPFRGNQYTDPGSTSETDREGVARRRFNEARQMRVDDLVASGHSREGAAIRVSREQRENVTEDAVRSALTDDLRHPKYRGNPSPYAGHCYVASEAVYHLLGGKTAGYVPQFIRHEGQPHWFLRSPDGRVIDPTRDQFKTPVPYDKAKGKGFLTSKPSARAARVLLRVRGKKAPFGRIVLKDFNPDQPRDDQGRWVDIFGGEQPSEAAPEAQTENATASGYAVDPDNAEQPQAAPPRMTDDEYNAKNEKWNEDADALAKTNKAIAAQGVDFIAEKCFRDDKFYHEVHERTSDEWQHIGGQGPATFRFASQMAFGLDEGGTFDSKAGRFITDLDDLDKTYPGAKDEATVQAGALRREYMETQAEISEGFTFNIAGDEDIDSDALSQMEQDAWNELGTSDKVDIIEGSKSLKEKALEWGMDNEDEVYKKAQEEDSASEPFAYEYVSTKEARDALADNEDAVAVIQKVNDFYAGRDTIEEDDTEDSMGDAMHAVERMQDQAESRERMTAEYVADRLGVGKTGSLLETIEGTIRDGERIMRADFTSDEEAHKSPFYEDLKYLSEARQAIVDYKGGEAGKPIPDASKIAEYVVSVGKFERQWAQERISEFEGEVASNFDSNALRDAVGDDRWESGYDEARRDWLDPYYLQTYAEADPDNEIYQKFSEDYEPDEYPRTDPEEVTINADDWPHKLIRTVSADVSNYTPNYAESWAYDRQSFGSQTLEDEIDHAQILVFQGAKNWTTPAGQASMGSRENEFIVLSQPPKWVREARDRWEKVQQGQMRESQSAGKLAQRETLMQQYRELQRLQDFGTSEQHSAKLDEVQRLATALGLDWDTLVGMARKK